MFFICSYWDGLPLTFLQDYICLGNNIRIKDDASLFLAMPFQMIDRSVAQYNWTIELSLTKHTSFFSEWMI